MEGDMKLRNIISLAALALGLGLVIVGQAAAKPGPLSSNQIVSQSSTPDLVQRWLQRQQPQAPDLVERYVARQPASAYYSPAALKAYGLRMQAMARTYQQLSANTASSSESFDVRDALVGAAAGIGIALCAGGILFAVSRSRRPQVAL
jgi:hypothetical protein